MLITGLEPGIQTLQHGWWEEGGAGHLLRHQALPSNPSPPEQVAARCWSFRPSMEVS